MYQLQLISCCLFSCKSHVFVDVPLVHDMVVIHDIMASYPETGAPRCKKFATFMGHILPPPLECVWHRRPNIDSHQSLEQCHQAAPSDELSRRFGRSQCGKQTTYPLPIIRSCCGGMESLVYSESYSSGFTSWSKRLRFRGSPGPTPQRTPFF